MPTPIDLDQTLGPALKAKLVKLRFVAVLQLFRAALGCEPSVASESKPKGCSTLILGCTLAHAAIPAQPPALVDLKLLATIAFLTRPITEEHIVEMGQCNCASQPSLDCNLGAILHQAGANLMAELPPIATGRRDPLVIAIQAMCADVHNAVGEAEKLRGSLYKYYRNEERAKHVGEHLHFPKEPLDLLPSGSSVCISSLLKWMTRGPGFATGVFPLLSTLITSCVAEGIPALIGSHDFLPAIESVVYVMTQRIRNATTLADRIKEWAELKDVSDFLDHLGRSILSRVEFIACAAPPDNDLFLRVCSHVFSTYNELLAPNPRPPVIMDPIYAHFTIWAGRVHHALSLPHDRARYHPDLLFMSNVTREQDLTRLLIAEACGQMINSHRCYAPACLQTQSRMRVKFLRCSGCRLMPYCSKECQASAWRHAVVPHKAICGSLKKIADIVEVPSGALGEWKLKRERMVRAPLPLAKKIEEHVEALFVQKMAAMESDPLFGEEIGKRLSRHQALQHQ